jgi:hypothetical protein
MSESGQSLPNWAVRAMSGLSPLATELRTSLVVRFVPLAEVREVYISLFGRCSQTRMWRLILTFAYVTGLPKFAYLIDAY